MKVELEKIESMLKAVKRTDWFCKKLMKERGLTLREWYDDCETTVEVFACAFQTKGDNEDHVKKMQMVRIAKTGFYLDFNTLSIHQVNEIFADIVKANTERNIRLNIKNK